jgi:hypothetical protein
MPERREGPQKSAYLNARIHVVADSWRHEI